MKETPNWHRMSPSLPGYYWYKATEQEQSTDKGAMALKPLQLVYVYEIKSEQGPRLIAETMRYLTNVREMQGLWSSRISEPE